MKANNLEDCKSNIPNDWGVNVPNEVTDEEKHLYHVLIVNRTHIPSEERYTTKSYVQKFNEQAWTNTKPQLSQLGYTRVFILHDPTKKEPIAAKKVEVKKEEV